ncbi:MAG: hypothetical protein ACOC2Q_03895, partial [Spirochaetota bacterium]
MPALQPTGLMVNLLAHPERTTISTPSPRFTWIVNASHQNAVQQGARILVSTSRQALVRDEGDAWDTGEPDIRGGWATDQQSVAVTYEGRALESRSEYWWKVRVWLAANDASPWSAAQRFVTGELGDGFAVDHYLPEIDAVVPKAFVRMDESNGGGDGRTRHFADFGRAAFGTIRITMETPESTTITFRLGEVRKSEYAIDRTPGGSRRYR